MVRGPTAARSTGEETASILGRGARVRGRVAGDGDLRVEGQIEGEVAISGELTIEEGASIHGDVGAAAVVIGGTLRGDVTARGAVAVHATADVEGDLGGAEVSLDEGASFHGRIEAEFDMPAELGSHAAPAKSFTMGETPKPPAQPVHGRGR